MNDKRQRIPRHPAPLSPEWEHHTGPSPRPDVMDEVYTAARAKVVSKMPFDESRTVSSWSPAQAADYTRRVA